MKKYHYVFEEEVEVNDDEEPKGPVLPPKK